MKAYGQRNHCLQWLKGGSTGISPGFTLIELMVCIVIIAIMVAAAVPAVNGYMTRHAPQYAAEELWGDIQLARLRAARNNQRCQIQFNAPGPNQYQIVDVDNNGNIIAGGPFKVVNLAKFRDNITFVPSPVAADPPPFAVIEFLSQGTVNLNTLPVGTLPANSNGIYLSNQGNDVFYRVLVSLAGGTAVHRLDLTTGQWRTNQ
ncbi:MAG: GspH/FimT family pseudopilin [Desulfobacteraceae bacterium]